MPPATVVDPTAEVPLRVSAPAPSLVRLPEPEISQTVLAPTVKGWAIDCMPDEAAVRVIYPLFRVNVPDPPPIVKLTVLSMVKALTVRLLLRMIVSPLLMPVDEKVTL